MSRWSRPCAFTDVLEGEAPGDQKKGVAGGYQIGGLHNAVLAEEDGEEEKGGEEKGGDSTAGLHQSMGRPGRCSGNKRGCLLGPARPSSMTPLAPI